MFIRSALIFLSIFSFIFDASAAYSKKSKVKETRSASLVVDTKTGRILHAEHADQKRYPASLVKMMTLYMTFEKLKSGELKMSDRMLVSKKAASQPRLNLDLKANSYITVRDAVLGIIVHSANDAAVILAEKIGGTESNFAKLMTIKAKLLGMKQTTFRNASGLGHKEQKSTAFDMAKLAISLKNHFPKYYHLFSTTKFSFKGKTIDSHNRVVKNYAYSDGLKTGFINDSGFNIVTTAKKNGHHLVGVVFGGQTASARDKKVVNLLDKYFALLEKNQRYANKETTKAPRRKTI